jgi:hypothetical protein
MRRRLLPGRRTAGAALAACVLASLAAPPLDAQADGAGRDGIEFFEKRIRPVLADRCYGCHAAGAKRIRGGLRLDTRQGLRQGGDTGPAVVPGDARRSLLLAAIRHAGDPPGMPPDGKLPDAVISDFETWVAMGAPDPRDGPAAGTVNLEEGRRHWSFQPISDPPVPTVKDPSWPRTDIDRFILAALEAKGLRPVGDAGPYELARRVAFDLTGLPPTPAEVDAFVRDVSARGSPSAVRDLVDRLLDATRFGERWGRHWLDVARYADSTGTTRDVIFPLAFRYRDYVIAAFNQDKPYDQFVREQLAGDRLPAPNDARRNEHLIATGFLTLGVKSPCGKRLRPAMVEEQIDVTGRALLGLTIGCARCHDHKFDPIPTRDYYALAGIFLSSEPLLGVLCDESSDPFARGLQPLAGADTPFSDADLKALLEQRLKLSRLQSRLREERRRALAGRGAAETGEEEKRALWDASPGVREAEAELAARLAQPDPLRQRYNASLAASAMAVRDATPVDSPVHIRGDDRQPGEVVPRGFLSVLTTAATPRVNAAHSGRLELAHWIASADNPLTSRVMVNRVWQNLFGRGLVETPDDFGKTGQPPSHPELLDHLARRFTAAHAWSVKKLIREIMTSRVYQLGTAHDAEAYERDSANRLHWRRSRRRLDAEAIRDALLFIGGELDLRPPPARFPTLENDDRADRTRTWVERGWLAAAPNHRSVYLPLLRGHLPEDLLVFDFPRPDQVVGRRAVTTVPTQALYMMNSPFVVERCRGMARRVLSAPRLDDAARVEEAFALILNRPPAPDESRQALASLRRFADDAEGGAGDPVAGWAALCQALCATAEFRYLY